jgi:hypothetical protein
VGKGTATEDCPNRWLLSGAAAAIRGIALGFSDSGEETTGRLFTTTPVVYGLSLTRSAATPYLRNWKIHAAPEQLESSDPPGNLNSH